MRKVVSNTTPLISLLKINKLYILKELYKTIYVPREVFNEIEAGKNKEYYVDLSQIDWIKIVSIQNTEAISALWDLDQGEAEAIVLASEINASLIILDETLGRNYAKRYDLNTTGTLGVLLKAKQSHIISELKPLLFELRNKNIWLSQNLISELLILAKEI